MAAIRSSALDRLFERDNRTAKADRARPWRRHDRATGAWRAAQRFGLQLPALIARRPLSLVLVDRLDHVELPGLRAPQRHDLLHLRWQPERIKGRSGLADAMAIRVEGEGDILRRWRSVF